MMSIYTVENANGTAASLPPALPTQGALGLLHACPISGGSAYMVDLNCIL